MHHPGESLICSEIRKRETYVACFPRIFFLSLSPSLLLFFYLLYVALDEGKRDGREISIEIGERAALCGIIKEKDTLILGHVETRSMLLELMKTEDYSLAY